MKKIVSAVLTVIIVFACVVFVVSCMQQPKPHEVVYDGHRISIWMTREEIEGMLGEGTERKSQISPWGADVVAYGENLEICYVGWGKYLPQQLADCLFFNGSKAQSYQGIKAGDDMDTVPAKYEFYTKIGTGYEVCFLQGQNVGFPLSEMHDVRIGYHEDDNGKIDFIEIENRIYTPLWG